MPEPVSATLSLRWGDSAWSATGVVCGRFEVINSLTGSLFHAGGRPARRPCRTTPTNPNDAATRSPIFILKFNILTYAHALLLIL